MSALRLMAVIGIFFCTAIGWFILGGSIAVRTEEKSSVLGKRVVDNWGGEHRQMHPVFYRMEAVIDTVVETTTSGGKAQRTEKLVSRQRPIDVPASQSKVEVFLDVEYRQKGLLWYTLYSVVFSGSYDIHNPTTTPQDVFVRFIFPSPTSMYDDFLFQADGEDVQEVPARTDGPYSEEKTWLGKITLAPQQKKTLSIRYRSQGSGTWQYTFGNGVQRVKNFELTAHTAFTDFDIPEDGISPSERTETAKGWDLVWRYTDVISHMRIAVDMPQKLNPGPVAQRISFFAPVSLLFFFTILLIISGIRQVIFHPMHYFFLAAGFFAFHLLFAYLVDHVQLEGSFLIASLTSVLLIWTYMRKVAGQSFSIRFVLPTQVIYLILFSYSFFFEGYTGLTITIGAIVTLFVLMQTTAKTDWNQIFGKK